MRGGGTEGTDFYAAGFSNRVMPGSNREGIQAFGRRHSGELNPRSTAFLCLECLSGPELTVLEGDGMLRMRDYPPQMRSAVTSAAAEVGVHIRRGVPTVAAARIRLTVRVA